MKAPVFKGVGRRLEIESLPDPTPAAGDIVLRVARCGICGTDIHMASGEAQTFPEGTVIGHEFAGEVVAVGPGVDTFRAGDLATAMPVVGCGQCGSCRAGEPAWCDSGLIANAGGFGQFVITKAHAAIRLPSSLSMDDGALIEPMAVGLHGVTLAQVKPGSRVLVLGSGAIGLAATFWARRVGAGRIVVAARSRRGEAIAMQLGATAFLQSNANLAQDVESALNGPPDVVFECVGMPGMLMRAAELVRPRGTVIILGNCMLPDTIVPATAMFKQLRIQGSMIYSLGEFQTVADVFDAGHVEPRAMITDIVGYGQLPEMFEALRAPIHQCKVMVDPWGTSVEQPAGAVSI
jgi:2-desacetyl-2-hydroxyethyl bacteriochlorophyllide A dehydrogenase